ncbi:MAG: hypothetical protein OSA98_20675 [Rubripirellula sp.]|nr:hypothetical protein [Rubripirellula sp.]
MERDGIGALKSFLYFFLRTLLFAQDKSGVKLKIALTRDQSSRLVKHSPMCSLVLVSAGEADLTSSKVTCPGCSTTLQLPAGLTTGKIKCPKCAKVLVLKGTGQTGAPSAPIQRPAQPQPTQPDSSSPFDNLPSLGSPGAPTQPSVGLPAAKAPARRSNPASSSIPAYRQQAPGRAAPKKKKSSGASPLKILLIVGGVVGALGLLGCAGLIGIAFVNAGSHSGWQTMSEEGYTFLLPRGPAIKKPINKTHGIGSISNGMRRETGSQYIFETITLTVAPPASIDLQQMLAVGGVVLTDTRPVTRDGVLGIHGTVVSGPGTPAGTQSEIFRRGNTMVFLHYTPFSKAKAVTGSTQTPRPNEEELDKPNEFFESLQFP